MDKYVSRFLADGETVVTVARDHWITQLWTIVVDLALMIVIVGLSVAGIILSPPWTWFGLALLLAPIGHLAIRMVEWWNRQYIITNRRLIQVEGTTRKRVSDTELEKINDVIMEQSAWGQMLNYGDIHVLTGSDAGLDWFGQIADPIGFKKALYAQKDVLCGPIRGRSCAVESSGSNSSSISDLIAELDHLRCEGLLTDEEFETKKRRLMDRI
ncbi:MAG: PH domain-containing protein [Chloroflexi bacterium]|nr:PH domain-containing protein [Chloroflexota bacterium]